MSDNNKASVRRTKPADKLMVKYTQLRLDDAQMQRLMKMQDSEIRKLKYPISRSHVIRKCIDIGLDVWERSQSRSVPQAEVKP